MSRWIDNNLADRLYMVNRISDLKNIDQESVEKDWWVTTVLKALFELSTSKYTYFKGGTSLSKGWNIINRFSEDIDIALYRDFFLIEKGVACARCENNNQIKMLRKASRDFVHGELKNELEKKLESIGFNVKVEAVTTHMTAEGEKPIDHDADPTVLLVHYPSIFNSGHSYVKPVVKIEISCLSMKEPFEVKHISSLISAPEIMSTVSFLAEHEQNDSIIITASIAEKIFFIKSHPIHDDYIIKIRFYQRRLKNTAKKFKKCLYSFKQMLYN